MNHLRTYAISITPTDDGYRAVCPGLPACAVIGRSREEALARIEDAIKDRIRDAVLRGEPVPVDRTAVKFLWIDVEGFLV